MATFREFVKSYSASVKRAEREQQRKTREAARQFKLQQKEQDIENASSAVEQYDEYINIIKSVHKDCTDSIDWNAIKNESKPESPSYDNTHETLASELLRNYKPSFFDKLLSLEKKKRAKLEEQIILGKNKDLKQYNLNIEEYNQALSDWEKLQKINSGIEQKSTKAYKEAIEFFNPFQEIGELGSKLSITFESEYVIVNINVKGNEVIPNYVLSQTTTGKLSKKNMPISKFNELYQDYICSCVLRLSREVLAYLPINFVIVNAISELLNPSTGHVEEQPILSVLIPPDTLDKINFQTIDPSDSMKNFVHNMKFSKANGFSPVSELEYKLIEKK